VFKNPTIDFNVLFNSLGNSSCSSPEVVLAFLLYNGSTIHNASDQFVSCVYFFFVHFPFQPSPQKKSELYAPNSNSCIFTPIENWTHVYMNLFTRNSPHYHILKYLLFLLKHPVYPTRCNFTQFIYIWKLLYMFRVVPPPIIRSAYNCIYSIWYLSQRYYHLPLSWKSS